jgi:erythromycin esterase-like protein
MKQIVFPVLLVVLAGAWQSAPAQESTVILPLEAQTCDLPSAPARIPPDADYDTLVKAKGAVTAFQAAMLQYRECLDSARGAIGLTQGNEIALTQAHNYSVEMEERIAEQFNVAVRAYKARNPEKDEG